MATRATYSFANSYLEREVTFYIHWDGYPEGAAAYFWNMHSKKHWKGELAEIFIKANPESAEFTDSHDYHGDTEYRYYMDAKGILTAQEVDREAFLTSCPKFLTFFQGHYAEFINQYSDYLMKSCNDFEKLYLLNQIYSFDSLPCYMTLTELKIKVLQIYSDVVDGCSQYRKDWTLWEAEYQRVKQLAASTA